MRRRASSACASPVRVVRRDVRSEWTCRCDCITLVAELNEDVPAAAVTRRRAHAAEQPHHGIRQGQRGAGEKRGTRGASATRSTRSREHADQHAQGVRERVGRRGPAADWPVLHARRARTTPKAVIAMIFAGATCRAAKEQRGAGDARVRAGGLGQDGEAQPAGGTAPRTKGAITTIPVTKHHGFQNP